MIGKPEGSLASQRPAITSRLVKPTLLAIALLAACGTEYMPIPAPQAVPLTYQFGPFPLAPHEELADLCVAVTLHNDDPIFVNAAAIEGALGIHHSNWFWVPDNTAFAFPEGTFKCSDGGGIGHAFDQSAAALFGGVLAAQSTQATKELQAFPPGSAIRIAPRSRIIATVHLLNAGDNPATVPLSLTLTPLREADVVTLLAGFSAEDMSLALPAGKESRFTVECDMATEWDTLYRTGQVTSPHIDFKIYHALAHYHAMGTALTFEAIRDDGTVDTVWSTKNVIGDELGDMLDPPFDMTGHSKVRLTCEYYNPDARTVRWGNGDGEMCIAFVFTDSTRVWTAGVVSEGTPGPSVVDSSGVVTFTEPACTVLAVDGQH